MRKEYHIPTIEVIVLELEIPIALAGSKDYGPAPERLPKAF